VDDATIEQRVLDHLESLVADFTAVRIDPAYANTALFCEQYGYSMDGSANCIVVAGKTGQRGHAACLVQATRRLDVNGVVRRLLGVRKASFADPDETVALTGMLPDGVTPFGLPDDLVLYVDQGVMQCDRVIVGGGSKSLKIEVAVEVFERMPNAQVIEGLARPPS
jgi:prolyl-tRNA editing enzyme YbaK/EbsC (Cys-tRNA(Pro) deacylase)